MTRSSKTDTGDIGHKFRTSAICALSILLLFVFPVIASPIVAQSTLLGVLEDVPGSDAGDTNFRGVRVVFHKNGTDWQAFPSICHSQSCLKTATAAYPQESTWTIAFDGRCLGQVVGHTPKDFGLYSHIGLQSIFDGNPIPVVGKKSAEYGGFTDAAVYRPLVANSQPSCKDPDSWKPSPISATTTGVLRAEFRQKFLKLCKASKTSEGELELFPYRDEDITVVKAYVSSKGWTIASLHLANAIDCNDTAAGSEIANTWFALGPQKSTRYLGQGMWLVDAGDYDSSGKSQLIFSIDRENRGGYELFYDDFTKHATFEFTYH
jgi:hypothetical protein